MKKSLIVLLLGILIGAIGWHYYQRVYEPTITQRTQDVAEEVKQKAAVSANKVGEFIGDAGIIALIKGKYAMDRDFSVLAIGVQCTNGRVLLTGRVASANLIPRAVEIAQQTKGVTAVTSQLTVKE
jgi:osmotically-inducible protein OsmY